MRDHAETVNPSPPVALAARQKSMKTVTKALTILRMFSAQHIEWSVSDLAAQLGLDKSNVHRLLRALAEAEFIAQDPHTKRYRLGAGVLELARNHVARLRPHEIARPHLEALRAESGETAALAIRDGLEIVVVQMAESRLPVRVSTTLGARAPLHCSAAGKIYMAFCPEPLLAEVLGKGLKAYTANTITRPETLRSEVEKAQKQGWAAVDEEHEEHIRVIAAPVWNATGSVEACVALRSPTVRLKKSDLAMHAKRVMRVARAISLDLGFDASRAGR